MAAERKRVCEGSSQDLTPLGKMPKGLRLQMQGWFTTQK